MQAKYKPCHCVNLADIQKETVSLPCSKISHMVKWRKPVNFLSIFQMKTDTGDKQFKCNKFSEYDWWDEFPKQLTKILHS